MLVLHASEVVRDGPGWRFGSARRLDAADPFPAPTALDAGEWLLER